MRIKSQCKIESCVTTDKHRPSMQNVWIDDGKAICTDGHVLAVVPVQMDEHDTPGYISPDALKAARKAQKKADKLEIAANGSLAFSGITMPRPTVEDIGKYPNWSGVFPSPDDPVQYEVAINVDKLKQVADAIGVSVLRFKFRKNTQAVELFPYVARSSDSVPEPDARGLVMPVRLQ